MHFVSWLVDYYVLFQICVANVHSIECFLPIEAFELRRGLG